jgi:hypothetical protein
MFGYGSIVYSAWDKKIKKSGVKHNYSLMWWHTPAIPALWRLRQEAREFKAEGGRGRRRKEGRRKRKEKRRERIKPNYYNFTTIIRAIKSLERAVKIHSRSTQPSGEKIRGLWGGNAKAFKMIWKWKLRDISHSHQVLLVRCHGHRRCGKMEEQFQIKGD